MSVTLGEDEATTPIMLTPGKRRTFVGTLTDTSSLQAQISFDGGTTWDAMSLETDPLTALTLTATFPPLTIKAPDEQEVLFRVATVSGTGTWAIRGLPGPAVDIS
jgi:hypothetical protein